MGTRVVYGNSRSENGWPMVDQGSCTWITVPGTTVTLQIQNGQPLALLRAFAADFNAYVEPLRDADSACWTPTNSVGSSNHLSGTACDLNWNSHPFQVKDAGFDAAKIATMREMLSFYEDTVFWGNDWSSPKDAMHVQCGYNTYNNPKTADFVARKIRADGYSTFRRGNTAIPATLSRAEQYALAIIREGERLGITPKGIKIGLATPLVETNLTMYANSNVPASLSFPHDKVGSDHDSTGLFQQRQAWGPLSETMDPTLSARLFFTGGRGGQRGLTAFDYNSNSRTPGGWAQAVQVSAFPDRYDERYSDAEDLYNRLSSMSADLDEWEALMASTELSASRSIYRTSDNKTMTARDALFGADASAHATWIEQKAFAGDPWAVGLIASLAAGQLPASKDPWAVDRARFILSSLEANNPAALTSYLASKGTA